MPRSNASNPWLRFGGEMIVPLLLLGYSTRYYLEVAALPRPETNLLLIEPVYALLVLCCVAFAGKRLVETVRERPEAAAGPAGISAPPVNLVKSISFIVLTAGYIWAIPVVGFVVTTMAYTFLQLLALGVRSPAVLVLTPTLLSGLIWSGMEHFLNLRLPAGLLF